MTCHVCSTQGRLQWNPGPEASQYWSHPERQHSVSDAARIDTPPAGGVYA